MLHLFYMLKASTYTPDNSVSLDDCSRVMFCILAIVLDNDIKCSTQPASLTIALLLVHCDIQQYSFIHIDGLT